MLVKWIAVHMGRVQVPDMGLLISGFTGSELGIA